MNQILDSKKKMTRQHQKNEDNQKLQHIILQALGGFDEQVAEALVHHCKKQRIYGGINQRHKGTYSAPIDKNGQKHQQISEKMRVFNYKPVELYIHFIPIQI
jgi:hypothetical protein